MQHKIDYAPAPNSCRKFPRNSSSCTKSPALSAQDRTLQQKQARASRTIPARERKKQSNAESGKNAAIAEHPSLRSAIKCTNLHRGV